MKDIIGTKRFMLTVLSVDEPYILPCGQKNKAYKCLCDCGKEIRVRALHFNRWLLTSCGCSKFYNGKMTKLPTDKNIRKLWESVRYRCSENRGNTSGSRDIYYGRGIRMCDEWVNDYSVFEQWAKDNGYKKGLDIDRIDNYKGYSPDNCRFVTRVENCRNKRDSIIVEYKGEKLHLKTLMEKLNIKLNYCTVRMRLKRNWSVEDALFLAPSLKRSRIINGQPSKRSIAMNSKQPPQKREP